MKLAYEVTTQDYQALIAHARRKVVKPSRVPLIVLSVAVGVLSFSLIRAGYSRSDLLMPLALLLLAVFSGSLLRSVYRSQKALMPSGPGLVLGPRTLEIDASGLRETGAGFTLSLKWELVREAVATPNQLFLYVDNAAALIIPTKSLPQDWPPSRVVEEIARHTAHPGVVT